MNRVNTIKQLKELSSSGYTNFYILLNGGVKSSKRIQYDFDDDTFLILNEIDDTEEELTEIELYTKSNIGDSLNKGVLYSYE